MEKIIKTLRRSRSKKNKTKSKNIDSIDDTEWGRLKTEEIADTIFRYHESDKNVAKILKGMKNEKREDVIEHIKEFKQGLEEFNGKNRKPAAIGINLQSGVEDITNVSTDFTVENHKRKIKDIKKHSVNSRTQLQKIKEHRHKNGKEKTRKSKNTADKYSNIKNRREVNLYDVGEEEEDEGEEEEEEDMEETEVEETEVEDESESKSEEVEEEEEEEEEEDEEVEVEEEEEEEEIEEELEEESEDESEEEESEEEEEEQEQEQEEKEEEATEIELEDEESEEEEEEEEEEDEEEDEEETEQEIKNKMTKEEKVKQDSRIHNKKNDQKSKNTGTTQNLTDHEEKGNKQNTDEKAIVETTQDSNVQMEESKSTVEVEEEYVEEKLDVYTLDQIESVAEVATVKGKGRCMFTKKTLEPGAVIFIEKPVLIITPTLDEELWNELNRLHDDSNFDLPLKWHFAAFCSITLLDETNFNACIDKWVPEPDREPEADVFNVLNKVCKKKVYKSGKEKYYYKNKLIDPKIYDRMIQVWHYNAFGHHTDNEGLVLYNRISMLAHSCNSTACWHYGENDTFVLRARVKLNPGDELTISYLGDDDLYKSSNIRREKLTNWLFFCMCSRCANPVDNSRGFKCPTCGMGTFFIKKDSAEEAPIVTKCSTCMSEVSESTAYEYIEYENSYVERLQETDKSDLLDALSVYTQADKIFTQHWVIFQLSTILFEGYRDAADWEKAIYYQMIRIKYAVDVIPRANYVLAWLYEELGEILANSISTDILLTETDLTISYESKQRICTHFLKSIHLLEILCGYSHDYLKDSLSKYYRIDSLTTTDAPQLEE